MFSFFLLLLFGIIFGWFGRVRAPNLLGYFPRLFLSKVLYICRATSLEAF